MSDMLKIKIKEIGDYVKELFESLYKWLILAPQYSCIKTSLMANQSTRRGYKVNRFLEGYSCDTYLFRSDCDLDKLSNQAGQSKRNFRNGFFVGVGGLVLMLFHNFP